jgi:hypothetical protein
MLPPFNAQGDLPPGVHQATLREIIERFGQEPLKRVHVTESLQRVIALAQETGQLERVFIWGSDVTAKLEPRDIDVFLLMALHFESDTYTGAIRLVFDSEAAERELGATVLWMTGSAGAQTTFAFLLEQFQIRRDGARRGLVEVL